MAWDSCIGDEIAADFARLAGCLDLRRAWMFGFHKTGEDRETSEAREENRAALVKLAPQYADRRKAQLKKAAKKHARKVAATKRRQLNGRACRVCSACGSHGHDRRNCKEAARGVGT